MLEIKDLVAFIKNNNYWYGTATKKLSTYLSINDNRELKLGFYTDLSMGDKYNSLYDLSISNEYSTDIKELSGSEVEIPKNESVVNEQNDFYFGVYELTTNDGKLYLGELYDTKNKYARCDYLFTKQTIHQYLNDMFMNDSKHFPSDLVPYI
jgi:hypothetical protein